MRIMNIIGICLILALSCEGKIKGDTDMYNKTYIMIVTSWTIPASFKQPFILPLIVALNRIHKHITNSSEFENDVCIFGLSCQDFRPFSVGIILITIACLFPTMFDEIPESLHYYLITMCSSFSLTIFHTSGDKFSIVIMVFTVPIHIALVVLHITHVIRFCRNVKDNSVCSSIGGSNRDPFILYAPIGFIIIYALNLCTLTDNMTVILCIVSISSFLIIVHPIVLIVRGIDRRSLSVHQLFINLLYVLSLFFVYFEIEGFVPFLPMLFLSACVLMYPINSKLVGNRESEVHDPTNEVV